MLHRNVIIALFSVCIGLLVPAVSIASQATLVHNVKGYTLDDGQLRQFSAISFADGVVTELFDTQAAADAAGLRIDGGGAILLPGLIDAHGHVWAQGMRLATVDLLGTSSAAEAAERVAVFMGDGSDGAAADWVEGGGWNQVLWPDKSFPDRSLLDTVSPERPVALSRVDGHALWVNSSALTQAGIDATTPDPEGGQILRREDGSPTGVLIDNAMALVFDAMPQPDVAATAQDIARGLNDLAANGLTAVHDAGITAHELAAYRLLLSRGEMPIRVYAMLTVLDPANDENLAAGPVQDADGLLDVRSVKISADGALGSRGAALLADYSDDPGNAGLLLMSDETMRHHMQRAAEAGFQVNVHAIGDRANRRVLDAFAALPGKNLRHRIEHAQILHPEDIDRFAELDVIASIQPTHATSDKNMAGDRLGEERLIGAYAWKSLLDQGARLAGGSDFPVESPNPFYGLHAAVTRQDHNNQPLDGWLPAQKLGRVTSLALFTEGAAYAAHAENRLGRLLPGYAADFILVKDDPFTVPEADLWKNQVLQTWVGGRRVFAE